MSDTYEIERPAVIKALMLGLWLVACDTVLKLVGRAAHCGTGPIDVGDLFVVWKAPGACESSGLIGDLVSLQPGVHDGLLFGLAPGAGAGFNGQLVALGILAVATVVTILMMRWPWRTSGDPRVVATVLSGALLVALPRLVGDGSALVDLSIAGAPTSLGEICLAFGLLWAALRAVGELRA